MKILYILIFCCFTASSVSPGYPPLVTTMKTLPQESSPSSTEPSPTPSVLSVTEVKTDQQEPTKLKDTTVVIIISVSLALLVFAIIPLIFYGHCQTNTENQNRQNANKGEAAYFEENAGVSPSLAAVGLPSLNPESSTQDASQYAAIYQALDPKTLD